MRKPLMAALAAGLIVLAHGVAAAQPAADPQQEIQAVYNRASAAAVAARTYADAEALHRWLDTPDCLYADFAQPPKNWVQMRDQVEQSLAMPMKTLTQVIRKLDLQGTTATATSQVEGTARRVDAAGRYGPKGAEHDIVTRATVRDVWVKSADGWRRKSHEQITPNGVASVDGKPPVPAGRH